MNRLPFTRAVRLILGLRTRRFFNRLGAASRLRFGGAKKGARVGGAAKRGPSYFALALLCFIGLAVGTNFAWWTVRNISAVNAGLGVVTDKDLEQPAGWWKGSPGAWKDMSKDVRRIVVQGERDAEISANLRRLSRDPAVADGLAFVAALILLMLIAGAIGASASDLAKLEEDVEWMLAMPVSATAIYAAKAAERTLLNLMGWFSIAPLVTVVAFLAGEGWWSLPIGAAAALLVNGVVSCFAVGLEMASHRLLRPSGRRNLQAGAALVQVVLMLGSMSFGTAAGRSASFLYDVAREAGPAARWLPGGLAMGMLHAQRHGLLPIAALAAWVLGSIGAAAAATAWASARGLEAVQADAGRRGAARAASPASFGGVFGKELRLLLRDRVLLMQIALLPVIVAASQIALNPGFFAKALASPLLSGAVAFGVGAYTLMSAAPGVLFHEKDALWLLYTFPRPIGGVVLRKALLWTAIAAAWALGAVGFSIWKRGGPCVGDLPGIAWIVVGLPAYALIAASLGVLGFDATATEISRRLRVDLQYLVMLLGGMLGGGLWLQGTGPRVAALAVFAALAGALWVKASARFEILLDPAVDPPRRLDAADGLVAVALFLYLQTGLANALSAVLEIGLDSALCLAAPFAAATAIGGVLLILWRTGLPLAELPAFWPKRPLRSVGEALLAGAGAGAVAIGWRFLLPHMPVAIPTPAGLVYSLVALVTAPFLQELLFRGLVFQPARRFLAFVPAALGSALVFALMAPPLGFVPALALGIATAVVQERSKGLLASMVCHAICAGGVIAVFALK